MEDVHERRDHLTNWLHPEIKKALYVYWETDEGFRHRRLTNRANRALAYGSVTFMKTNAMLSKSLDCDATIMEAFKYTHILKENKERFADQRSMDHFVMRDRTTVFTNNLHTSTLRHSSASVTNWPVDAEDGVNLREQVLELITRSLHQQVSGDPHTRVRHRFSQAGVEARAGAVSADGTTDGGVPRLDAR
ncbi:hypothetical protein Ahy_B04g072519 [Arachis hypogaea]|uniref:Uncharacterized protein n=1 Tax=Arachis hypogaea TaxID=3818 RepID=A0A444ZN71_ARAHY|nr:hypothetical protein Ahy_B04g072519 [Arachis hypogaea]